jgi:hypothetical protein
MAHQHQQEQQSNAEESLLEIRVPAEECFLECDTLVVPADLVYGSEGVDYARVYWAFEKQRNGQPVYFCSFP